MIQWCILSTGNGMLPYGMRASDGSIGHKRDSARWVCLEKGDSMFKRVVLGLVCVVLGAVLLVSVGCTSDSDEPDSSTSTESSEDVSEDEAASADEGAEEAFALAGSWENAEGSVFREITFYEDGTADTVNYGDVAAEATWTLEDDYLKVETASGESWGSPIEWISDPEFDWANESGTWTQVE